MNENLMNKEKLVSITTTVYDGMDLDNFYLGFTWKKEDTLWEREKKKSGKWRSNEWMMITIVIFFLFDGSFSSLWSF